MPDRPIRPKQRMLLISWRSVSGNRASRRSIFDLSLIPDKKKSEQPDSPIVMIRTPPHTEADTHSPKSRPRAEIMETLNKVADVPHGTHFCTTDASPRRSRSSRSAPSCSDRARLRGATADIQTPRRSRDARLPSGAAGAARQHVRDRPRPIPTRSHPGTRRSTPIPETTAPRRHRCGCAGYDRARITAAHRP